MALTFTTGYTFTDGDVVTRTKLNDAVNSATYTGTLEVAKGGTGSTTAADARTALGVSATADVLLKSGNLSGIANAATARGNLGEIRAFNTATTVIDSGTAAQLDVAGLSINLTTGNTYHITMNLDVLNSGGSTDPRLDMGGTATFSSVSGAAVCLTEGATNQQVVNQQVTSMSFTLDPVLGGINGAIYTFQVRAVVVCNGSGTLKVAFSRASAGTSGSVTALGGGFIRALTA